MKRHWYLPARLGFMFVIIAGISGCSTPENPEEIHDPYEPINRVSHAVNKGADRIFFKPASQGYGSVVPEPVRTSLSNVASYLDTPRSVANDHVCKATWTMPDTTPCGFLVNIRPLAYLGFFDPATSDFGLARTGNRLSRTRLLSGAPLRAPIWSCHCSGLQPNAMPWGWPWISWPILCLSVSERRY